MRHAALLLTAILAVTVSSCATPEPPAAAKPVGACNVGAARTYVGQAATPAVAERARQAAGAGVVRMLDKDAVITMEYRADRLNLITDAGRIINATCS